jgi:hypothetical protein
MTDLRRRGPASLDDEEIVDSATTNDFQDEKGREKSITRQEIAPVYSDDDDSEHYKLPPETAEDFVTEVIHARDDPTLNPWTFRTAFLG